MSDLNKLSTKLEKLINTRVEGSEPPRLVRANSAFELYGAIEKAKQQPELLRALKD